VTLERRRLWKVRASLVLVRWLVYALVLASVAAAVRVADASVSVGRPHAGRVTPWRPIPAEAWDRVRIGG
jgi:hypothetical protein